MPLGEEIGVISEELLQRVVAEQAPQAIKAYGKDSGASDAAVVALRLDFQNILRINNLWSFANLKKLQLDNNIIEKIENLEMLVHLEWLDLSFNNIERIEGLETLVNLTDLSLHNNQIHKIEGLDTLKKLETLSLGNNLIATIEDAAIQHMRSFASLRCLNLAGCGLCGDEHYESYIIAYLPQLRYLDYRRITPENRSMARARYQDKLEILEAKEEEAARITQLEEEAAQKVVLYQNACVPGLTDEMFFVKQLDPDYVKLRIVPHIDELFFSFFSVVQGKFKTIASAALVQYESRREEKRLFFEAIEEGKKTNRASASELVDSFLSFKDKTLMSIHSLTEARALPLLQRLENDLSTLKNELLALEVDLVGQLEDTLKKFERNFADMVMAFIETVQANVTEIREHEEKFHKEMSDAALIFSDKFSKGEIENALDYPDDVHALLRDKTTLANTLSSGHDVTLVVIDSKEDEIIAAVKHELETIIQSVQKDEVIRNRSRVAEISKFVRHEVDAIKKIKDDLQDS